MALTIEMPPQMAEEMRGYAVLDGMSIEQMCLDYIALEMKRRREAQAVNPFASFCGTWSDDDFNEFQSATKRVVNPQDWQ